MLTIEVKINGRLIASAAAANVSGLAENSDYSVSGWQSANRNLGIDEATVSGHIRDHRRAQSAWSLVGKIAGMFAARGLTA